MQPTFVILFLDVRMFGLLGHDGELEVAMADGAVPSPLLSGPVPGHWLGLGGGLRIYFICAD